MIATDAPASEPDEEPALEHRSVRNREDAVALAVCLARPVVRGFLPFDHAEATLAAAIGRAWRLGMLPDNSDAEGLIHVACHILGIHISFLEDQRDSLIAAIRRRCRPLIAKQDPPYPRGTIRAAAHDLNGERGFLLSESEVEEVLIAQLRAWQYSVLAKQAQLDSQPQRRVRRYHG